MAGIELEDVFGETIDAAMHERSSEPLTRRPSIVKSAADSARRRMTRAVHATLVPNASDREVIFHTALRGDGNILFQHLNLRSDGGLRSKENIEDRLFNQIKILQVFLVAGLLMFNFWTIFTAGTRAMGATERSEHYKKFALLLDNTRDDVNDWYRLLQCCVSGVEMLIITSMLFVCIGVTVAVHVVREKELQKFSIWFLVFHVSCSYIPYMQGFSAMRALHYLNPQTLISDLRFRLTKLESGYSHYRVIGVFILLRLSLGALGFLAFVVKFVHLQVELAHLTQQPWSFATVGHELVLLIGFINQAYGITQLWAVQRNRVFLFIFGGEDAVMQAAELDRGNAYLACLAHSICTRYFANESSPLRRQLKRFVALLTFSHLDMQALVIEEEEETAVSAAELRSG
eukprot:TRINITY_DN80513_c0_g1_i1.p1 TRINITY_DN80513_c0_g1~~TRINITY_DN80513_c0_g1_i1.p1  ORF type:complete len:402 (-),score=33.90 TRINITY_DN80513_c0_g1_i1:236-1441(-)